MKKIFLTSGLMMCVVMPTMAVPTNTSNTFPNDELMQADYTYTNQATYENTGVYSDSVDAEANYDWELVTVNAGYYLPANSTTPVQCTSGNYCPGLAQQVHMDDTNAQGLTACPTGFTSSTAGATTDTQCYRACDTANMGNNGTIPTIAHAMALSGKDYYGGTANDTCAVAACEYGYHIDNGACSGNVITITWNSASAEDIAANNAGTVVYGEDIRTPRAAIEIPGKRFIGWKFRKPFDLSTLDATIDTTFDSDHTRWKLVNENSIAFSGQQTMQAKLGTENSSDLNAGEWADTFSYGTVKGESLCSSTSGVIGMPGNPTTSSGSNCWCRVTQYQATGSDEWQSVSPSDWVYASNTNMPFVGNVCDRICAYGCANGTQNDDDIRRTLYGIMQ